MDLKIYLASKSPRRRELLAMTGLEFEVMLMEDLDEDSILSEYPGDVESGLGWIGRGGRETVHVLFLASPPRNAAGYMTPPPAYAARAPVYVAPAPVYVWGNWWWHRHWRYPDYLHYGPYGP